MRLFRSTLQSSRFTTGFSLVLMLSTNVLSDELLILTPQKSSDVKADDSAEELHRLKQEKYDEIERRLNQLTDIWRSRQQDVPDRPDVLKSLETDPEESDWTPPIVDNQSTQIPPGATGEKQNADRQTTESDPSKTKTVEPIKGAIDRVSLASSLFANRDYEACLQTLEAIESPNPSQTHWLTYLRAGCLRQLGDLEESQRQYRHIVAAEDSEWLGELAAWWLDQLTEKRKLRVKLDQVQVALEQWRIEVDELVPNRK